MVKRNRSQFDHDRIRQVPLGDIRPAPENENLYGRIDRLDRAFRKLVESVAKLKVREPLVLSGDGYIISGHRRYAAAQEAGLPTVPCRVLADVRHDKDPDEFLRLLREHNLYRDKTFEQKLHEELLDVDPGHALQLLHEDRRRRTAIKVQGIELGDGRARAEISKAKIPFLEAVKEVILERRDFWPLSDRQVHYALLNNPPLIHSSKLGSIYRNDKPSYRALVDLLTRARLAGHIMFCAIGDETRPVALWESHTNVRDFLAAELRDLFSGYRRKLMASQANHIELLVEKNTVRSIIEPIAEEYGLPLISGRGYCSLPPRNEMANRYLESGKDRLIVLMLSDFDPDGEAIASSFGRSLRDDFGVQKVDAVKVALTVQQVKKFHLPPSMTAKAGCATRKSFVDKYGENVFELEALDPAELQQLTRDAIESVIDRDAFHREVEQEQSDAAELVARRQLVLKALGETDAL